MEMKLECPICGNCSFEMKVNAKELNDFFLVCENCGERIATVNRYAVDWVEDDEDAKDSD